MNIVIECSNELLPPRPSLRIIVLSVKYENVVIGIATASTFGIVLVKKTQLGLISCTLFVAIGESVLLLAKVCCYYRCNVIIDFAMNCQFRIHRDFATKGNKSKCKH